MSQTTSLRRALTLLIVARGFNPGVGAQPSEPGVPQSRAGVIVESVAAGSAGARAGIKPGDVLLSWARAAAPPNNPTGASGDLRSPFDMVEIEVEQAPRGALTLAGTRGSEHLSAAMGPGSWGISSRPQLPPDLLAAYQEGVRLLALKQTEAGADAWQRAAAATAAAGSPEIASWLYLQVAKALLPEKTDSRTAKGDGSRRFAAYERAVETARGSATRYVLAQAAEAQGDAFAAIGDGEHASGAYLAAQSARLQQGRESLAIAQLARKHVGRRRWDTFFRKRLDDEALKLLRDSQGILSQALLVAEKLAPGSMAVVEILNEQALVAATELDLGAAWTLQQRAAAMEKGLGADSSAAAATKAIETIRKLWESTANSISGVGGQWISEEPTLVDLQDDLERARQIFDKLYPSCDEAARGSAKPPLPGCRRLAHTLNNLGMATAHRGDPTLALVHLERALAINEALRRHGIFDKPTRSGPGVLNQDDADFDVTRNQNNLGFVALLRGDLYAASDYFQAAFDSRLKCGAPCAGGIAGSRQHLATVIMQRGNFPRARELFGEALATGEARVKKADPRFRNSGAIRAVAAGHKGLGDVAYAEGKFREARRSYGQALKTLQEATLGGLDVAAALTGLGRVARETGHLPTAVAHLREAMSVIGEAVPDGADMSNVAHLLGTVLIRMGRVAEGEEAYAKALSALDSHARRLGGAEEARSRFVANRNALYYDYVKLLVDQQRHSSAFELLERSRAQSFRALLAERDLAFGLDLPADLDEERRATNREHDAVHARLKATTNDEERTALRARLRLLRDKRESIAERVRRASPRLASIQQPHALDLAEAQGALDEGTVLLSYAVGEAETLLFVVQPSGPVVGTAPGLTVLRLPVGRKTLTKESSNLRELIRPGAAVTGRVDGAAPPIDAPVDRDGQAAMAQGGRLFDALIRPAYALVAASRRVLISADGPLHELPFAALVDRHPGGRGGRTPRFFVEWKPLHVIGSVAVYADLKRERHADRPGAVVDLVAFGDPDYGNREPAEPDPRTRSAASGVLDALPHTRAEVTRVASLYHPSTRVHLGLDATERRFKELGGRSPTSVRYLHVASHGLLDPSFPLNSALAFSAGVGADGEDNGLLQAWEIYEQLRVDAELVTLSACETGLGEDMGGEGLISLSRAFLYAGAHSVLASLWKVRDDSTAHLMTRFYSHLKAGRPKDEALRAAQLDLIQRSSPVGSGAGGTRGEWSHPYHWAGFVLIGDWRSGVGVR